VHCNKRAIPVFKPVLTVINTALVVCAMSAISVFAVNIATAATPPPQPIDAQNDVAVQDRIAPQLTEANAKAVPEASTSLAAPAPDPLQIWGAGLLGATQKVADNDLAPISLALGGYKIFKSNNPEIFYGPGWLAQNARSDAVRGGQSSPVSGCTNVYYFHINRSGATAYLHLLASNPQNASVTVSAKGSTYNNAQKPLNGVGTGQSYFVAKDWRAGTFGVNFSNRAVPSATATEISKIILNPNNMVDGRFEVCASAGVYLYTVITTGGSTIDAINKSQGGPASGDIFSPAPNAYGREAGIYAASLASGLTNVVLPTVANQHIGFAYNTTSKFNAQLQEQTAAFTSRLSDSTDRTYGNYGHKFDNTFRLFNTTTRTRTVRLSFASSFTASTNTPSFTFSTPASINGTNFDIWTTPTAPKQIIGSYTIAADASIDLRLTMFIAGLGVANQQVIVETMN
jgi:Protein of unknown function (DUF3370)